MHQVTCDVESSSEEKEWVFQLTSIFCSFMVWAFGMNLAISKHWRLWDFNSTVVKRMYFGLWKVYYYEYLNISGVVTKIPIYSPFNSSWTISPEIEYARDLISLANFLQPVVLIFSSVAMMVFWIQAPYPQFMALCYNTSILFLVITCFCTTTAVTWNHMVDLYGQTSFDFPLNFPVEKDMVIMKHNTHVFPLGILMVFLSFLSIIMLIYETWMLKKKNRVKPAMVMGQNLTRLSLQCSQRILQINSL